MQAAIKCHTLVFLSSGILSNLACVALNVFSIPLLADELVLGGLFVNVRMLCVMQTVRNFTRNFFSPFIFAIGLQYRLFFLPLHDEIQYCSCVYVRQHQRLRAETIADTDGDISVYGRGYLRLSAGIQHLANYI